MSQINKEKATAICRSALENGLVRGRSIAAITAASVYVTCRLMETPQTLKDVAAATKIQKKDLARCYRLLVRELNLKMPIEDPIKHVKKIAESAQIKPLTQKRAISIIEEAKAKGLVPGKDPAGLAAAATYIACVLEQEGKTQRELALAARVTEVTVRNRSKGLKNCLNIKTD